MHPGEDPTALVPASSGAAALALPVTAGAHPPQQSRSPKPRDHPGTSPSRAPRHRPRAWRAPLGTVKLGPGETLEVGTLRALDGAVLVRDELRERVGDAFRRVLWLAPGDYELHVTTGRGARRVAPLAVTPDGSPEHRIVLP